MSNPIKIIIADDHTMFLNGLASLLSNQKNIELVNTANNGKEVLLLLQDHKVDVVISDLSMPEMDGKELLTNIKSNYPTVRVIALTMHEDGKTISKIIKDGIDGYVLKDAEPEELLEAIATVMAEEKFFGKKVQRAVLENLVPGRKKEKAENLAATLTEREKEILILIAREYTQDEIAEKLFISPSTVVYHKRKLMLIMEVKSIAGLVRKAAEMGLLE